MNTSTQSSTRERLGADEVFSAPLGDLKKGQFDITNGIANFELRGDASLPDLFHARFSGIIPDVRTRSERVLIRYRLSALEWFLHGLFGGRQEGEVRLNTSIPWQIELRGGASHLEADLRELQLRSLEITGGISDGEILLPRPVGTVQVHVASGVSHLRIFRPQDVPARLNVGGGISQLVFDDQSYGSIGGGLRVETPDYKTATDRYDIVVGGGVSHLSVRPARLKNGVASTFKPLQPDSNQPLDPA